MQNDNSQIQAVTRSHPGLVRLRNEDHVWWSGSASLPAACVADGMGGLLAGDLASEVVVKSVREAVAQADVAGATDANTLSQVVCQAHARLCEVAEELGYSDKMGSTLLAWKATPMGSIFAHAGDSRLYAFTAGHLQQVSEDHTVTQRLVKLGQLTPGQALLHQQRHVLTQALGLGEQVQPQVGELALHQRLLLCTDGLSDMVGFSRLEHTLAMADLEACADELLRLALDEGGTDNISLVLIEDRRIAV